MQLLNIARQQTQSGNSGNSRSALFAFIGLLVLGANTLFLFLNLLYTYRITQKEFPSLVQTLDGQTIELEFEDPTYRSPETIKYFVTNTLYHLMTMSSYGVGDNQVSALDPDRPKAEPVPVDANGGRGYITQNAWLASESLEPKFAEKFKAQLAEITSGDIFTGKEEVILKYDYVTEPEKVLDAQGRWTQQWVVDIVGTLKVFRDSRGLVSTVPFNKRVTVRPVQHVQIDGVEEYGEIAEIIQKVNLSGLQITDIKDIAVSEAFDYDR